MPDGTEHNIAQLSMTQQCKWFGLRMSLERKMLVLGEGRKPTHE